ncbi:MAG: GHMP family kinase ATP-binding protein [Elusimicrobiota bacterium]
MRVVRAPLRITLGGGGTDLPGYYEKFGGFLIAAAINKYIYITASPRHFDKKYWMSYSKVEVRDSVADIEHELLRKSLEKYRLDDGVEIHSISEVPGESGLGSSGAFLVCAITALNSLKKKEMSRHDVAELASGIEMKELGHACGKQDQFIAAFGGIISLDISKSGEVAVQELDMKPETVKALESSILIYHTGVSRKANEILSQQTQKLKRNEHAAIGGLSKIKEIGYRSRDCLLSGDIDGFGRLLHEHWSLKKSMQAGMSSSKIDEIYDAAMRAGMLGGKIMGAGGGGFFMFCVPRERQTAFRSRMNEIGLAEMDWRFSFSGCEVIFAN